MARPQKQTADYFPHYAVHGKTMFTVETKYGVVGYAAWFKLLEILCVTPGHCYYSISEAETEFMVAKMGFTDTETWLMYMETLVKLEAIDGPLWQDTRGVWCQNLVDNLASMYSKRTNPTIPTKPVYGGDNAVSEPETPFKVSKTHKVDDSKLKESKSKESKDGGRAFEAYREKLVKEYPGLDIAEQWERCQIWYRDHNKTIKSPSLALANWCRKEVEMTGPKRTAARGAGHVPTAEELDQEGT